MSTRSTKGWAQSVDVTVHLYHEMHDDCFHLELTDTAGSYSFINVVIPTWMADDLSKIIGSPKSAS